MQLDQPTYAMVLNSKCMHGIILCVIKLHQLQEYYHNVGSTE